MERIKIGNIYIIVNPGARMPADHMPMDRNGIHATGMMELMPDGRWLYEYENGSFYN